MTCLDLHDILSRFAMSSCDDMSFRFHLFSNGLHGFPNGCHCFSLDFMGFPMDFNYYQMNINGKTIDLQNPSSLPDPTQIKQIGVMPKSSGLSKQNV